MGESRRKYDLAFKDKVITEYFQGASAKELYQKYGVKERTIYAWSKSAKENITVTPKKFVKDVTKDNDIHKKMKNLEERVVKMEEVLNNIKK